MEHDQQCQMQLNDLTYITMPPHPSQKAVKDHHISP